MNKNIELPHNPYNDYMKAVESKHEQMKLDFQKWLESEVNNQDMSGRMLYCALCPYSDGVSACSASQEQRLKEYCCSNAYRKLMEYKNKK
jgi:hypothetical protein